MRFLFKTDYEDDIRLFPHSGYVFSYGILLVLLVIAPFVLSSYLVSQLVFVCIYATVGVALLILTGFTGQASLGHAAFLAIGAYTAAYLQQFNVPFPIYFLAAGRFRLLRHGILPIGGAALMIGLLVGQIVEQTTAPYTWFPWVIVGWVADDLTGVKIAELLARRGVEVPCRTVQRYIAQLLKGLVSDRQIFVAADIPQPLPRPLSPRPDCQNSVP